MHSRRLTRPFVSLIFVIALIGALILHAIIGEPAAVGIESSGSFKCSAKGSSHQSREYLHGLASQLALIVPDSVA